MTERLADISAHIGGIRQLGAVVNAMRGIAASRAQQARSQLAAVDSYAATIAAAIGRAAAADGASDIQRHRTPRRALLLFCAEQGFAGAYSERVLDAVRAEIAGAALFLIGTRGAAAAAERGIVPDRTERMPVHSASVPKFADRLAEALYARILAGGIDRVDAVFGRWRSGGGVEVARTRLFPLDPSEIPAPAQRDAPLLNLPAASLLGTLTADYVHARLCHATLHAFAAENEARMEAMAAARGQIERQLAALQATQRQVRQDEITAEIIELAAGETASRVDSGRIAG